MRSWSRTPPPSYNGSRRNSASRATRSPKWPRAPPCPHRDERTGVGHHFWQGRPGLWKLLLTAPIAQRISQTHADCFRELGYRCDADPELTASQADANWVALHWSPFAVPATGCGRSAGRAGDDLPSGRALPGPGVANPACLPGPRATARGTRPAAGLLQSSRAVHAPHHREGAHDDASPSDRGFRCPSRVSAASICLKWLRPRHRASGG